jgi:glucuronate isomerase
LPIVSPHGYTDPAWFALNEQFPDAVELLIKPDHYLVRMLYSQGISLESLGIAPLDGSGANTDSRQIWRLFAENFHLFAGTPSRIWLDHVFNEVFGLDELLNDATADRFFDRINECLGRPEFRPRALFDRFNVEVLATTESPLDSLEHHQTIRDSDWNGRVITTYRPDPVVDPDYENFRANIERFGEIAGADVSSYSGYLAANPANSNFSVAVAISASTGYICHANLPLRPGLLGWFFNTPEWHQLHHSLNYDESNTNYGCTIIIWDRVFGTFCGKSTIERVGNGTGRRLSLLTQYTLPFRSNKIIRSL